MVEEKIRHLFSKYPGSIYGFTSISYSPYAGEYRSALVFAVPYGEQLSIDDYAEERFEKGIRDAQKITEEILIHIEEILNEGKVKYDIPPASQNSEKELTAPLHTDKGSQKAAAPIPAESVLRSVPIMRCMM